MKTAISIPDRVFREAERLARRLGVSRSELYTNAIRQFIAERDRQNLTGRMNEVCDRLDSSLDPALRQAQLRALGSQQENW